MRRVLLAGLVALAAVSAAQARTPLRIGAVVPELLDASQQDATVALMREASLGDVARVTVTWQRGQTQPDPGIVGDLGTGAAKAAAAGIDVYLDVYPNGSSQTPLTASDQTEFADWTAALVRAVPLIRHVIVGNEPNLNLFWMPQFGPGGDDAAAAAYERLLARTYDAVKAVAPQVEVVGGALAHLGANTPGTARPTHSPAQFILDLGAAYRASGRTRPIMDAFSYHPYMEHSSLPPTFRHLRGRTLTIADYGKLVSLLGRAFDGTAQKGTRLPVVYDEFGVETRPPAGMAALYSGTEATTTHPVDEATQARYYAEGMHLAACEPTVEAFMVFELTDSPLLPGWQSGVYYADGRTPKSSEPAVAAAARRWRTSSPTGCAKLLQPQPLVDWTRRTLLCDVDCAYTETFRRLGSKRPAAVVRARTRAAVPTRLPRPRVRPGRYRVTLVVRATPYKADAATRTSPLLRLG